MSLAFHTDDLIAAIIAHLGSPEGGIAATIESYPLPWPTSALLPAVFLHFAELRQREPGRHLDQEYLFSLFYVMEDGTHARPQQVARQRAQQIAASLMSNRRLGITAFDVTDSLVTRIASDNPVMRELRARGQRRTAVQIDLPITVAEAR